MSAGQNTCTRAGSVARRAASPMQRSAKNTSFWAAPWHAQVVTNFVIFQNRNLGRGDAFASPRAPNHNVERPPRGGFPQHCDWGQGGSARRPGIRVHVVHFLQQVLHPCLHPFWTSKWTSKLRKPRLCPSRVQVFWPELILTTPKLGYPKFCSKFLSFCPRFKRSDFLHVGFVTGLNLPSGSALSGAKILENSNAPEAPPAIFFAFSIACRSAGAEILSHRTRAGL